MSKLSKQIFVTPLILIAPLNLNETLLYIHILISFHFHPSKMKKLAFLWHHSASLSISTQPSVVQCSKKWPYWYSNYIELEALKNLRYITNAWRIQYHSIYLRIIPTWWIWIHQTINFMEYFLNRLPICTSSYFWILATIT